MTKLLKSSAIGRVAFHQLSESRLRIGEIPHQSKSDTPHVLTHNRGLSGVSKAIECLKCFGNFALLKQPLHGAQRIRIFFGRRSSHDVVLHRRKLTDKKSAPIGALFQEMSLTTFLEVEGDPNTQGGRRSQSQTLTVVDVVGASDHLLISEVGDKGFDHPLI